MAARTYLCETCGQPDESGSSRAKYCGVCRTLRNMQWVGRREFKCWLCSERFTPIARDDAACAKCALVTGQHPIKTCVICETEAPCLSNLVDICFVCGREKAKRPVIIRALLAKQRRRIEAPTHELVDPATPDEPTLVI